MSKCKNSRPFSNEEKTAKTKMMVTKIHSESTESFKSLARSSSGALS